MSINLDPLHRWKTEILLDRPTVVVTMMLALDALWWTMVYQGTVPMPGMSWLTAESIPMAAPGAMEAGVFHVGDVTAVTGYVVMWGVMMWAMMEPAMTRFTRDYAAMHNGSSIDVASAVASFLAGYHLVWTLSAIIPLTYELVLPGGIYGFTQAHPQAVIGSMLVLSGIYQLSRAKRSLLRTCCARVPPHADGVLKAFQKGLVHGITCMLICFGLFFLVMPFFGEMNFFWMVVLTGVVALERIPTWGREVSVASGIVALIAGLGVLVFQPNLPIVFVAS